MKKNTMMKYVDMLKYKRLLKMQNDDTKEFFNVDGCGLEIEFGVDYEKRCRHYIENGLKMLKSAVGSSGKFVPDMTIGHDLNVEIVLNPFEKDDLKDLFATIKEIILYYENFVFDENCGVHANFRADDDLKRLFYESLADGGYDSSRFIHSKYKTDFLNIVMRDNDLRLSYDEYIEYQLSVSGKYAGINFLKENLVEFRTLDLNWDDIEYVIDVYEDARHSYLREMETNGVAVGSMAQ